MTRLAIRFRANAPPMTETAPSGLAASSLSSHSDSRNARMEAYRSIDRFTRDPHRPADVTFVLISGGHNAGIIHEPGHPGRRYDAALKQAADLNACLCRKWARLTHDFHPSAMLPAPIFFEVRLSWLPAG